MMPNNRWFFTNFLNGSIHNLLMIQLGNFATKNPTTGGPSSELMVV